MYAGTCATGSAAVCGLAATGLNVVWLLLAAFALLGAGLALLRVAPRGEG